MITPVRNISFKTIKKQDKTTKANQIQSQPYAINSLYANANKINFSGYLSMGRKITAEEGIENNFFQLPKITLEDGTLHQIQPDKSQIECAKKLCNGKNVVFDAPTGMGKTAIAHFAMNKNLFENKKTIYTVPIKALANDKYVEFSKIYGAKNVGILTGDRKINTNAPITIMTTEIFENQAQSMTTNDALKIGTVVYDEAHYIGDEERGMAWEHSIMNAASKGVQILALSATIGNANEFAKWIGKIPGARPTERVEVKSENRPVPLVWHLYRQDKEETYLAPILIGEVDLSSNLDDLSYAVIDLIYEIEKEYFERRHEANKDKPDYDNRFLIDASYRSTIAKKLKETLGENWINTDFLDYDVYTKLKEEFKSIAGTDLIQINNIAEKSGVRALSDTQRKALEVLYKAEYEYDESYQMTDDDYDYMYRQLKMAIGDGQNSFRYDTQTFGRKLGRVFRTLNKDQIDQITQLMSRSDVKNSRMIHENWQEDNYTQLVEKLESENMLPAIIFKLAQGGCEQVANAMAEGDEEAFNDDELSEQELKNLEEQASELDLLTQNEKQQVIEILDKYEKQGVYLGLNPQKQMLLRGWGVHHAGRLPQYKKLIEELFSKKLIKVVVATSTLGAGINMPAKTVVMTNTAYKKYNPDSEEFEFTPLTANEFHQMAGRAGRRGIDVVGHVVLYNLHTPPKGFNKEGIVNKEGKIDELQLAYKLMMSGADDVRSSFRPQPAMLAKYYSQNPDTNDLRKLIKQSFRNHLSKDKEKFEKQMLKKFENFSQVLVKLNCVSKNYKKELELTPKGEILMMCQGMNPLVLATLLYDEKLAKVTPAQLAQIAGHIQGTSEQRETAGVELLVSDKIKYAEVMSEQALSSINFEVTKDIFRLSENKVLKALREGNVNRNDIKEANTFAGLVSYMFASLNQNSDNSIENFEKIVKSTDTVISSDYEANKEYKRNATEGNIYKIIAGSISTLKQIIRICDFAISCDDKYPNTSYWEQLREKAQEAIKLLDKEPINNNPEYANKSTNN